MGFEDIQSRTGEKGGHPSPCPENGIRIHKDSAGKDRFALRFNFGRKLFKACRWQLGDKLRVQLDYEAKLGLISRVVRDDEFGWTVGTSGGDKNGMPLIKMTPNQKAVDFIFPNGTKLVVPESVEIKDEGILFSL